MNVIYRTRARRMRIASLVACLTLAASTLTAQAPDRSAPPPLGPPPILNLPEVQEFELSNGARVVLMEKHNVPLVQVNLVVKAGSAFDPLTAPGLASVTADMLDEGAGTHDALELADEIDFLGADLRTSANDHDITIALHTPRDRLELALQLMADVALRPTFPEEELERQRIQRLTTLLQWRDRPGAIATASFAQTLYGESHPYGLPSLGTEASLRSFTVEDLRSFHEAYFHASNAVFIVVGDITADVITASLETLFGTWEAKDSPSMSWPEAKQVQGREVYLVDKPGAAQSEIRIGRIGVPRLTEDYYALVVMNTILGGSFASRLNQNLREEHGYTYGARTRFDFNVLPGPFVASAAVQTDVTDKALVEFMKELNGILEPVSDEELTRARNFVALRFPSRFQRVATIASQIGQVELYGLPDDYFATYVERILAVTKEDVLRVAREYVDPDKVAIIVVGDREVIEDGVRALDLGPLHVLSIEDVLGAAPVLTGTE